MANTSRFATSSDIIAWYPTLSAVSPTVMQMAIDSIACLFDVDAWGCSLLMGSLFASAHVLLLQQAVANSSTGDGPSGPVSSMSMGPVSESYAIPTSATENGSWGLTTAGQQYLALRKTLGPFPYTPAMDVFTGPFGGYGGYGGCGCL